MTSQTLQKTLESHVDFFTAHAEPIRLWLPLWQLLAEGAPVSLEQLASLSHRPLDEIKAELPSLDVRLTGKATSWPPVCRWCPLRTSFTWVSKSCMPGAHSIRWRFHRCWVAPPA